MKHLYLTGFLAAALAGHAASVLHVVKATEGGGVPLLQNGGFEIAAAKGLEHWFAWQQGFRVAPGEGRNHSQAVVCERREGEGEFGVSQTIALNRTNIAPLIIRGWSRAENVTGSPDNGYSLYLDIIYADDTSLWGQTVSFDCGTHDWEERRLVLLPDKPIKTLTLHCLFRGHTGKVWFDDVSLAEVPTPTDAFIFQGAPARLSAEATRQPTAPRRTYATRDGLKLAVRDNTITSLQIGDTELAAATPSGFLARDFAANSDVFDFSNAVCAELNLRINSRIEARSDHLSISGTVTDLTGKDRAITLLFALPVDATGWQWGDDMRTSRRISGNTEFADLVNVGCGANGKMSRYPLAAIWNQSVGLALALDMTQPAQYRLVYHPVTRQFFLAYDLALVKDTARFPSRAEFRLVCFRFDPHWGFRAALQKFYDIFPQQFVKRVWREGVWMPFTDIAKVPGFADFGFAFQEGAPNVAFDDQHDIASFVYVEPMSYWIALPSEVPRTYAAAMQVLTNDLGGARSAEQQAMAAATFNSGIHTSDGKFSLYLVKAPWCDGGVFTLNPDPDLPVTDTLKFTKASVMHRDIAAAFQRNAPAHTNQPHAGLDGVYLDSLEMSATQLNYRREHFRTAAVPLVFDREARPAQLMIFNTWEFARDIAAQMHRDGKLMFANAVLWNYAFPAPLLDVLGTEVNWLPRGEYLPDSDAVMNFRRALCFQKPYCLLMNTDYEKFTSERVERYFQRCLFYGVWPGFFDQDAAAKDPYWASTKRWYDRDRALFKKYIPLFQRITAAGWHPITLATCDNAQLWLERYGTFGQGAGYLTVFNNTAQPQEGVIVLSDANKTVSAKRSVKELLSDTPLEQQGSGWKVRLEPESVAVLELQF